eukprot:488576-Pelagomonas_calceolata.AAC.1
MSSNHDIHIEALERLYPHTPHRRSLIRLWAILVTQQNFDPQGSLVLQKACRYVGPCLWCKQSTAHFAEGGTSPRGLSEA